jgi:uncharacterized Zn-binding protein involved in type VI secretion
MTVMPGTQKVTFNGRDTDYESKKRAAMAQAGENAYIQGVQSAMDGGIGEAVRGDRTVYGNSNIPVNELIQGSGTFAYKDSPGNQATPQHQTGSVDTQVSSTNVPQENPDDMQTDALSNRLAMMARGGQGFPGLNNRNKGA